MFKSQGPKKNLAIEPDVALDVHDFIMVNFKFNFQIMKHKTSTKYISFTFLCTDLSKFNFILCFEFFFFFCYDYNHFDGKKVVF